MNDYAGLLSPAAREKIEETLSRFEAESSNQVVVAVFSSLDGESLEDFSMRLAERWKIGQAKKDNGVILIIFRDDRAVRIEVGYGLEGTLPDAVADQIIRREFVPRFRAGDYDGGVLAAVEAIIAATRGEYRAEEPRAGKEELMGWLLPCIVLYFYAAPLAYLLIFGLFVAHMGWIPGGVYAIGPILILEVLRRETRRSKTLRGRRRGSGHHSGWGGLMTGGGFGGSGGGSFGGGGGSFGGGGASGRW